jgi:hypothetical protein
MGSEETFARERIADQNQEQENHHQQDAGYTE